MFIEMMKFVVHISCGKKDSTYESVVEEIDLKYKYLFQL